MPTKPFAEPPVFTADYLAAEYRHARAYGTPPVTAWFQLGDRIAYNCMRQFATHNRQPHPSDVALWQRVQRIIERHR